MLIKFQKAKEKISKLKIRSQLLIVFFLAGLLPILIVGTYLVVNNRNLVQKQHSELTSAYNVRTKGVILDITTSISIIANNILRDEQLQEILSTKYTSLEDVHEACRNYTNIDKYAQDHAEVSAITIYCSNPTMIDYGHFKVASTADKDNNWYKSAVQSPTPKWTTWSYFDQYQNLVVRLRFVVKLPIIKTGEYAVLVIDVNSNQLKSSISADPMETVISVNSDPVFYSSENRYMNRPMPMSIDRKADVFHKAGIIEFDNADSLLEVSTFTPVFSNDKIYIATVDKNALPIMHNLIVSCLLIVLFSILVPLVMVVCFSKTFSDRLNTLRREMHKVGQGNYDVIESYNGSGELMDLFTDMKAMIENIKSRDEEIYQDKIIKQQLINDQQKIEFKMLSSQINPHFLYNTLESIRMKAHLNGDIEVANAVKLLGKSMRHVLESNGSLVTLGSELEYIRIYLEIQKIRFKDRVNYQFMISESIHCDEYKMLPLLLQPIVENAMTHGLEEKETGGLIRILINPDNGRLEISIIDNGRGMTEEELGQLLEKVHSARESAPTGIGLYNVQRRLQMFYGEAYGLDIESHPEKGTKVMLTLPLQWEEKEHEGTDSR